MDRILNIIIILLINLATSCLVTSNQKILHDPTQPPSKKSTPIINESNGDTHISAIFSGKNSQTAIINDHVFNIGDKIANATIIAIDIDGVTLQNNDGGKFKIPLSNSTIVKTKTPITKNEKKTRENLD
jgi:hypothetical protein